MSEFKNQREVNLHVAGLMGYDGWDKDNLQEWVQLATSIDAGDVPHLRSDEPERYVLQLRNADTARSSVLRAFIRVMKRVNRQAIAQVGHPLLALSIE